MLDGRREAADVLHGHVVRVVETQVFVEHRKDLVVQDLELADPVNHLLQWLTNTTQLIRKHHGSMQACIIKRFSHNFPWVIEQVANLLYAQVNTASYPPWDRK